MALQLPVMGALVIEVAVGHDTLMVIEYCMRRDVEYKGTSIGIK